MAAVVKEEWSEVTYEDMEQTEGVPAESRTWSAGQENIAAAAAVACAAKIAKQSNADFPCSGTMSDWNAELK